MKKTNLKDVTFLFLVRLDSIERLENILASTTLINNHFETNIKVLECSSSQNFILKKLLAQNIEYTFLWDEDPILYRTKHLNRMLSETITDIVSVWDVDVIVPIEQIVESVSLIRKNISDCVYPYKKLFLETSPIFRKLYLKNYDLKILSDNAKKMHVLYQPNPVGGAFFCNKEKYIASGGENESFYGWGVEDGERYSNWMNYNYRITQVTGALFHLSHPRGMNSDYRNSVEHIIKLRLFYQTSINKNNIY